MDQDIQDIITNGDIAVLNIDERNEKTMLLLPLDYQKILKMSTYHDEEIKRDINAAKRMLVPQLNCCGRHSDLIVCNDDTRQSYDEKALCCLSKHLLFHLKPKVKVAISRALKSIEKRNRSMLGDVDMNNSWKHYGTLDSSKGS